MKVLLTGGAGFIGSFLVDALVMDGHSVTVLDSLEPQVHPDGKKPPYLNPQARLINGDVRDYQTFRGAILDAEIVCHLAAAVGVGQSEYEIRRYVDVNIGGTAILLDILANVRHRVRKLIVAGSMSSYGEGRYLCPTCGPVSPLPRADEQMASGQWELACPNCGAPCQPAPTEETKPFQCTSIYAMSKREQEEMALHIGRTYGLPTVALRYFNVYGPRQSLSNPYTGVIAIFLSRIKNNRPPIIWEDGLQSRDFVSVHDVVRATLLAMRSAKADFQAVNVGTGKATTIKEVADRLIALCAESFAPQVQHKYRKGDVRHCFADISKAKRLLGYEPQVSFDEGMRELIEWSSQAEAVDRFDEARHDMARRGLV